MSADMQMVGFQVGRETFAVPIAQVHEILRVPDIAPVPEAPAHVEGVMNLRGKIISVVDLRKRFGERNLERGRRSRVMVVEVDQRKVGLIVDSASEVFRLAPSQVEPPPHAVSEGEGGAGYVIGVGKLNGRIVLLVDLARVLRRAEAPPRASAAS
ncbi:MAG TPA: chemotaxis protein CheW [Terriglobales bacterium]|nr:chemotaxis protein CheW [Terriglobales bacterium]